LSRKGNLSDKIQNKEKIMTKTRVLIIDDEKENVRYLTTILEEKRL